MKPSEPNAIVEDNELVQLKKKLADVHARAQAREESVAEKQRIAELRSQLEHEERELENLCKLDELIEKYGALDKSIRVVRTASEALVVVKRPNHVVYKKFISDQDRKYESMDKLVSQCVVHPDAAGFKSLLEGTEPSLLVRCCNEILWLAGHRASELEGK
jgi:hypothetical protein